MAMIQSFHNSIDQARAYQMYTIGNIWLPYFPYITVRERNLTYQFFPHFHPYVPALVQRLNDGGLPELQDSDTLYLPQPNPQSGQPLQPLTVLPDSTRATLAADVTATRPGSSSSVALFAGTPMTLPNGTSVTIPAGTTVAHTDNSTFKLAAAATVQLPGRLPIASSSGIQWSIAGTDTIVPDTTAVTITLPAGKFAVLRS